MADYKATDSEFIAVANAIRAKGGTSAQLIWPYGFISAINAIPGGGSTPSPEDVKNMLNGKGYAYLSDTVGDQCKSSTAYWGVGTFTRNSCEPIIFCCVDNTLGFVSKYYNTFDGTSSNYSTMQYKGILTLPSGSELYVFSIFHGTDTISFIHNNVEEVLSTGTYITSSTFSIDGTDSQYFTDVLELYAQLGDLSLDTLLGGQTYVYLSQSVGDSFHTYNTDFVRNSSEKFLLCNAMRNSYQDAFIVTTSQTPPTGTITGTELYTIPYPFELQSGRILYAHSLNDRLRADDIYTINGNVCALTEEAAVTQNGQNWSITGNKGYKLTEILEKYAEDMNVPI